MSTDGGFPWAAIYFAVCGICFWLGAPVWLACAEGLRVSYGTVVLYCYLNGDFDVHARAALTPERGET